MNEFKKNIYRQSDGIVIAPPSYYSYNFSSPGASVYTTSCLATLYDITFYSSTSPLTVGTQLYTDTLLTNIVSYGNLWYKYEYDGFSYRINSSGQIAEIQNCAVSYSWFFTNPGRESFSLTCPMTSFDLTLYTSVSVLDIGVQMYLSPSLSTPVGSGNLWYKEGIDGNSFRIDNDGKIAEINTCV
jgi:hypothetical protein